MRNYQTRIRLLSFVLAIAVHAVVLFGSGSVSRPPVVGVGEGGLSVELVEGPPGGKSLGLPEPPPPQAPATPDSASTIKQAEPPPAEEMVPPDPGAKPHPVDSNLTASAGSAVDHPVVSSGDNGLVGGGGGQGTPGNGGGAVGLGGPRYGSNPLPVYPPEARRTGQQGTVVLSVLVNAQGAVETLAVKESSGHILLDQAALRAVRRWHFPPSTVAGIAVSSQVEQPVTFRLVQ